MTQCDHGAGTMTGSSLKSTLLEREEELLNQRGKLLPEDGWGAGQTKH